VIFEVFRAVSVKRAVVLVVRPRRLSFSTVKLDVVGSICIALNKIRKLGEMITYGSCLLLFEVTVLFFFGWKTDEVH